MPRLRPAALVAALMPLVLATAVAAAPPDDRFLAGYVAAVLERELGVRGATVTVKDGLVTVSGAAVAGRSGDVMSALRKVPGVAGVTVVAPVTSATPSPVAESAPPGGEYRLPLGLLPSGHLFAPLIADPKWPQFSLTYRRYFEYDEVKEAAAVTFGGSLALYRADAPFGGQWETGLYGAVFAILDKDTPSMDLVNADYVLGGFAAYRSGPWSTIARVFHQSSHLGDEFILHNQVQRVNLSYEAFDMKVSWDVADLLRLYGGGGWLLRREPDDLDRGSLQAGFEVRGPWEIIRFRPVGAVDLQSRAYNDWAVDVSVRAGFELTSPETYRRFQILLEFFDGHSVDGQFLRERAGYFGVGLHLHF
jgi:hypothetical protein